MNNKELLLQKVQKLVEHFNNGDIPTLGVHEVNPNLPKDDRINYVYFTLPVSINFQRSSPAMWAAALKTYNDPETNYLFYPEEVVKHSREKIQSDLIKHKLGLQKNKHTDIWIKLSQTLVEKYDSNPKNILSVCDYDVVKIITLLQIESKKDFPYLSGLKMSNYWLYILSHFTDVQFQNINEISIIPDTHVLQSTFKLGITGKLPDNKIAEQLWKELLTGSEFSTIQLHPVLWNWSRNNFKPEV